MFLIQTCFTTSKSWHVLSWVVENNKNNTERKKEGKERKREREEKDETLKRLVECLVVD